jgi:hypothetical protein
MGKDKPLLVKEISTMFDVWSACYPVKHTFEWLISTERKMGTFLLNGDTRQGELLISY